MTTGVLPIGSPVREQGGFLIAAAGAQRIGVPIPLEALNAAGDGDSGSYDHRYSQRWCRSVLERRRADADVERRLRTDPHEPVPCSTLRTGSILRAAGTKGYPAHAQRDLGQHDHRIQRSTGAVASGTASCHDVTSRRCLPPLRATRMSSSWRSTAPMPRISRRRRYGHGDRDYSAGGYGADAGSRSRSPRTGGVHRRRSLPVMLDAAAPAAAPLGHARIRERQRSSSLTARNGQDRQRFRSPCIFNGRERGSPLWAYATWPTRPMQTTKSIYASGSTGKSAATSTRRSACRALICLQRYDGRLQSGRWPLQAGTINWVRFPLRPKPAQVATISSKRQWLSVKRWGSTAPASSTSSTRRGQRSKLDIQLLVVWMSGAPNGLQLSRQPILNAALTTRSTSLSPGTATFLGTAPAPGTGWARLPDRRSGQQPHRARRRDGESGLAITTCTNGCALHRRLRLGRGTAVYATSATTGQVYYISGFRRDPGLVRAHARYGGRRSGRSDLVADAGADLTLAPVIYGLQGKTGAFFDQTHATFTALAGCAVHALAVLAVHHAVSPRCGAGCRRRSRRQ